MAKKKTYFQAISYTTYRGDGDGDLIAPTCWKPTASRTEAANQLMQVIEESFAGKIRTTKHPGPDYLVIECKHNSVDSDEWTYRKIKNWKINKKPIQQLQSWLVAGEIDTIVVTVPAFLQTDEHADVFHINTFTL